MKKIKDKLYFFFVEKNAYIRSDYEGYVNQHLEEHKKNRLKSWKRLLELNWKYRILREPFVMPAKKKKLAYLCGAESEIMQRLRPEILAKKLLLYDVISFDIFDTLILRPFAEPSDLFMLVGIKLDILNFKKIRRDAEEEARKWSALKYGNREITINDIYEIIERQTGVDKNRGIKAEYETEVELCFANPYMKRVFELLVSQGKEVVVTSDMYYPEEMIHKLLENCGYKGIRKYIISCDHKCSKASMGLYNILLDYTKGKKLVHVGDNIESDINKAAKMGIETHYYKNVNAIGKEYRPDQMSPITGSIYAGIVNAHLHNGIKQYSPYYEYGYLYGGIYVTGFCSHIYHYAKDNDIDKILFLSRDADIYCKVFNILYNDVSNEYVYWSRIPAIKTSLEKNRNRFILQCIRHKATDIRRSRIGVLLQRLELESLLEYLPEYNLNNEEFLTLDNVKILETLVLDHWNKVITCYEEEIHRLRQYVKSVVSGCRKVAIVDVGWTGSVVLTMKQIIESETDTKAECLLAGIKSTDLSEVDPLVISEKLHPYLFSPSLNRNLYNWHQTANRRLNSFLFEMMSQSNSPTFGGINENEFIFDIPEVENYRYNEEIHQGIGDFALEYQKLSRIFPCLLNISGYDAYQPFMLLCQDLSFIKKYFADFSFGRGVIATTDEISMETVQDVLKAHNL